MATYIAYKCKTNSCQVWLKRQRLTDDSARTITVPLKTEPVRENIVCPECKQEHEYTEADAQKITEGG